MNRIGFSTGALAKGNLAFGISASRELRLTSIELSALRLSELETLVEVVRHDHLNDFEYVSLHAPTDFDATMEKRVVEALARLALERHWPVIVHPDSIYDYTLWQALGRCLYIENMDKRKPIGRTVEELEQVLVRLPDAFVCFDIAHARQVDSSMTEAYRVLRIFGSRIRQIHFSELNSDSKHCRVSQSGLRAFREVAQLIPDGIPIILETPATMTEAKLEISIALDFMASFHATIGL